MGHEPDETAQGTTTCRQRDSCACKQRTPMGHEPDETAHGTTRCRQRDSCPCKQRTPVGHECKSKENGGVTRGQSMDHDQGRGLDLSMEFDRIMMTGMMAMTATIVITGGAGLCFFS